MVMTHDSQISVIYPTLIHKNGKPQKSIGEKEKDGSRSGRDQIPIMDLSRDPPEIRRICRLPLFPLPLFLDNEVIWGL